MDNVLSRLTGLFERINENIVSKKGGIVEKREFLFYFARPLITLSWIMSVPQPATG